MRQALLIVNPYSTNVDPDRVAGVEAALRQHVDLQTAYTDAPGHATELAAAASSSNER